MKTWAHSIHSLIATKILPKSAESILMWFRPLWFPIYSKEAIAFAKTRAFGSLVMRTYRDVTRLLVSGSDGAISYIFGTLKTAVFLT